MVAKQDTDNADRLNEAFVRRQQKKRSDPEAPFIDRSDLVFDPTRPLETGWESTFKQAAGKISSSSIRR